MAHYAYKDLRDVLPPDLTKDWEGNADYDSELWTIGADYILKLEKERGELKTLLGELLESGAEGPSPLLSERIKKALDN